MYEKTLDPSGMPATKGDESPSTGATTHVSEVKMFDQKETKKLLRKLDWHLIPFMSLIYLLCFLDRTNIGNARLDKLEQDLGLQGLQYNDCLAILFPFYIAAEIPSNIMLKRLRPSVWLTFIMVAWSACMICQGFVKDYSGLMATRVFLGVFEGWYCRHECGFRMALFFSAATLAGAFGGILARGIAEMSGVGGLSAWSWIFILEGLLSILVSFTAYWAIYDYPSTATFLAEKERDEVERRLAADRGHLSDDFDLKYVWQAIGDWKIYVFMLIFMAGFTPIYSFSLFLPTVIKGMGYSANNAQLMSVPPYIFACISTIGASWFADRARMRGSSCWGSSSWRCWGSPCWRGVGTRRCSMRGRCLRRSIPLCLAWNGANIGGSLKRGTGIAMQVMGGNCGGIIASYVYLTPDGPRYIKGHSILIGFVAMSFFLTLFMITWFRRENARRDALTQQQIGDEELTEEQKKMERELADNVPWFRYSI
ncbi:high-affinity nicotinic acid transporter [Apiospora saccharicola]